jgi:hypothetical protein
MNTYIGTKIINAKSMTLGEYNDLRGWKTLPNGNPAQEGYLVEYTDGGEPNHPDFIGYISWSPKEVFERAYRLVQGLTFGAAIEALKGGKRVSRAGWNGKGMYLWLLSEAVVPVEWIKEPHLKEIAENSEEKTVHCLPSIRMYTTNAHGRKAVLTGWLASQTDMLSEDWYIIE